MVSFAVSVVIPVFNVEKYIERCVISLMEQSLENIEYIFIDDCSNDNSLLVLKKVLDNYPERRSSVNIIQLPDNKGIAEVRRIGTMFAKGEYIIHCDSDDWIERDMYKLMYVSAHNCGYDIVVSDFFENIDGQDNYRRGKTSATSDIISDCLILQGVLWNKMIRRHLFQHNVAIWPRDNYAEDLAIFVQCAISSHSTGYITKPLYHYCRRHDSLLGVRTIERVLLGQQSYYNNVSIVKTAMKNSHIIDKYMNELVHLELGMKNVLLPYLSKDRTYLPLWKSVNAEVNGKILTCPLITLREKLNFVIVWLGLYPLYKKIVQ